jgi:hypothetical protein
LDFALKNEHRVPVPVASGYDLVGLYYPGSVPAGIMFLEGFGSDQTMLRPLMSEFADWGLHLFSFDFSGHGRSPGTIGFDNAASERLALEVLAAKNVFKSVSGLNDSQIIMIGHSMGARMGLWATVLDISPVAGLVLLGCQVNLLVNTQASFFTGVDDTRLAWIQALQWNTPATDIMLISGEWDDIITPSSANALYQKLESARPPATPQFSRELHILPRLVHNYEIYSPRVVNLIKPWVGDRLLTESPEISPIPKMTLRIALWIVGLTSIFCTLILLLGFRRLSEKAPDEARVSLGIQITDIHRFLAIKAWLWLGCLPFFFFLTLIFLMIPLGQPVFNLVYVGFISSYGILQFLLYRLGKMPGTAGRLPLRAKLFGSSSDAPRLERIEWLQIGGFIGAILLATFWYCRTGWWFMFPINDRLVWLFIYSGFSSLGFYIGVQELGVIQKNVPHPSKYTIVAIFIGFVPFILATILFGALGSLSGMIGSLQGLVILAFCYISGAVVQQLGQRPWLTALFQGVLLQLLVLPISALFAFF